MSGYSDAIRDVLLGAYAHRSTGYHWLARAVSTKAHMVLDVACGTGAVSTELARPDRIIIGLDWSADALGQARARSVGPWVQADARQLPFADASFDAVTSAMGLALIDPSDAFIAQVARVLVPGGVFVGLVPAFLPLRVRDAWLIAQISAVLGGVVRFPGALGVSYSSTFAQAGLTKVEDRPGRYSFLVRGRDDALRLLAALDVSKIDPGRVEAAADWFAARAERVGPVDVPIPLRRIVAIK